ncbi:MAG: ABC transporter ATP-binding protein [Armatimonadetes bacterium]|nr:ABC transporter ATP-binding protein [Armatimonadota bacterium]
MVELRGITKRFGPLAALDHVDLSVRQGEIHAIIGENGAGKTTLMRVLYGALLPDAGEIVLSGEPRRFRSAAEGIAAGIGMVSQHYSIIGELTCLENLMLGAEPGAVIHRKEAVRRADELAAKMDFRFDWSAEASGMSPGNAQKLEILKLLWRNSQIMILDEPTAMLSPADGDALFGSLKQLAAEGKTILLVTHRLPEVLEFCDTATVLRGGKRVASVPVTQADAKSLAELIVGHALSELAPPVPAQTERQILELEGVTVLGDRRNEAVIEASLRVGMGEVVGVAGVDGNGQRELFEAIMGVRPLRAGRIRLGSEDISFAPTGERLMQGLRLIPEDRHEEGVVEDWSLELNAALGLQRVAPLASGGRVNVAARREAAGAIIERFGTKAAGPGAPMASLSGGNQQRFVAARALALKPRLLLAFQPARGLDIDATRAVYAGIREACLAGAGAIVVSFDLDELLDYCDRIVVMNLGRLAEPPPQSARERAAIGALMVGA